jgi:NADH-quinone oxidoreductase subunit J
VILTVVFWGLVVAAIASALVVILHRNPIVSAMALAVNLVTIAWLFVLLDAKFMGLLQIIVYAGAIMVLILFVIMLLNLREEAKEHPIGSFQKWLAPAGALLFGGALIRAIVKQDYPTPAIAPDYGTAFTVGRTLFANFYYPFEAISLLLVAAMVGAVILAKRKL